MGSIATYIADKAAKKKQTPAEWMQSNLQNLERCRAVSHIARYTNPDVAISLHDNSNPVGQGYLTTADVIAEDDLVVNGGAAYMAIASFLVGKFSQKETKEEQKGDLTAKTAWQYFREDATFIRREIESLGIAYEPLREKILEIQPQEVPQQTDARLRQVYFPIGADAYHLLTAIPPVSLMFSVTESIETASRWQRKCRDKKSEYYGESYYTFSNITRAPFGGSQPQNMSCRNTSLGVDILPSQPPILSGRKIKLPKRNFFLIPFTGAASVKCCLALMHYFAISATILRRESAVRISSWILLSLSYTKRIVCRPFLLAGARRLSCQMSRQLGWMKPMEASGKPIQIGSGRSAWILLVGS